jgi:hypothetical protein
MLRQQGLADAAGADEADQPVSVEQRDQRLQLVVAAEQGRQLDRQVRAQRRGARPGPVGRGRCCRGRHGRRGRREPDSTGATKR